MVDEMQEAVGPDNPEAANEEPDAEVTADDAEAIPGGDEQEAALAGEDGLSSEEAKPEEEEQETEQLYELELERYRTTLSRGWDAAFGRYGFTMIHSISPEEYVRCRTEMGFKAENPLDWYNLGCAAAQAEDQAEAIKCFDKCLAEDARFAPALFNRAVVREQLEETAKAAEDFMAYAELLCELEEHQDFPLPGLEEREAEASNVRIHAENLAKNQ